MLYSKRYNALGRKIISSEVWEANLRESNVSLHTIVYIVCYIYSIYIYIYIVC